MAGTRSAFCNWTSSLCAALVASSCGSGNTTQSTAEPVPQAELPDQVASAWCEGLGSCCQKSGFSVNQSACQAAYRSRIDDIPTSSNVIYDASAAGECLALARARLAACGEIDDDATSQVCNRVFRGTLAPGAACTTSDECADPEGGSAYCNRSSSAAQGVCEASVATAHGKLDEACSTTCTVEGNSGECMSAPRVVGSDAGITATASSAACYTNEGLYCSSKGTCQQLSAVGGACDLPSACTAGAYCDLVTRLCVAQGAVGAACSSASACVDTAYCSSSGGCEAKKADGQPCADYDECLGYCQTDTSASTGVCSGGSESSGGIVATASLCTETFGLDDGGDVASASAPPTVAAGGSRATGGSTGTGGSIGTGGSAG